MVKSQRLLNTSINAGESASGDTLRNPMPNQLKDDVKQTKTVGTDYTVQGDDEIINVDTSDGPVTITVQEDLVAGKVITIVDKSGNAATNNITIEVTGALSILGGTTATINTDYGSARLEVNGDEQVLPIGGGLL